MSSKTMEDARDAAFDKWMAREKSEIEKLGVFSDSDMQDAWLEGYEQGVAHGAAEEREAVLTTIEIVRYDNEIPLDEEGVVIEQRIRQRGENDGG